MTKTSVLSLMALLTAITHGVVADGDEPRRCAAFVVGIETYDELNSDNRPSGLNNLQYVAEDAYSIWRQLETVTDFDHQLSRLMVAERNIENRKPSDRPLPEKLSASGQQQLFDYLDSNQVRDAFSAFLSQLHDADVDLVTVYFGGHGIINENAPSEGVRFTASNYESILEGTIRVRDLIADMRSIFGKRSDVDLVFFASMCHAGALAPGEAGDATPPTGKYTEASRSDHQEAKNLNLAYFPACGAKASTFERPELKAGEFAHYLRLGLTGANRKSSGKITTGGLIDYLSGKLKTIPPDLQGFRREIELGLVLNHEAEVRRLLGEGLLAVAQDHEDFERVSFLRLAAQQFRWCRENHHEHTFENTVLEWQANSLRDADIANLQAELERLAEGKLESVQPEFQGYAHRLTQSRQLRPFLGIVFAVDSSSSRVGRTLYGSDLDRWKELLQAYPVETNIQLWPTNSYDNATRLWKNEVERVIENASRLSGERDLVLVYTATDIGFDKSTNQTSPIAQDQVWNAARMWSRGRVVVIWDAPFGGNLANVPDDLKDKVTLFMSASQRNGLTFSISSGTRSTAKLVTDVIWNGLTDSRLDQLDAATKRMFPRFKLDDEHEIAKAALIGPYHGFFEGPSPQPSESLGVPAKWWGITAGIDPTVSRNWTRAEISSPPDGRGFTTERTREEQLRDGSIVEVSYTERVGPWEYQIMELASQLRSETQAGPFALLRLAALHEARGDIEEAKRGYQEFADDGFWREAVDKPLDDVGRIRLRANQRLREFVDAVRSRKSVKTSRIHLVPVAAKDYQSPLIGDLVGTDQDIGLWIEQLSTQFGDDLIYKPYVPKNCSARAALKSLRLACKNCKPDESVVFIFSGRGYEDANDKYLLTEEVAFATDRSRYFASGVSLVSPSTAPKIPFFDGEPLSATQVEGVVDEYGVSGVAIYDCQFTKSSSFPLQKHLFATWPDSEEPTESGEELEGVFVDRPDSNLMQIWWTGPLVDSSQKGSGMARGLTKELAGSAAESYLVWLENVRALRPRQYSVANYGTVSADGNLTSPIFSVSGISLVRLLNDYHLKLANLDITLDLLSETGELLQRPEDMLARIALHSARASLIGDTLGNEHPDAKRDIERVTKLLTDLKLKLESESADGELNPELLRGYSEADLIPVLFRFISDRMASDGNAQLAISQAAEMIRLVGDDWVDADVQQRLIDLADTAVNEDRQKVIGRILKALDRAGNSESVDQIKNRVRATERSTGVRSAGSIVAPWGTGRYPFE